MKTVAVIENLPKLIFNALRWIAAENRATERTTWHNKQEAPVNNKCVDEWNVLRWAQIAPAMIELIPRVEFLLLPGRFHFCGNQPFFN